MKEYEMKCPNGYEPRILVTEKFVKDNNFVLNYDEVVKILKNPDDDFMGFKANVAINYISAKDSPELFDPKYVENINNGSSVEKVITDINESVQDFLDYMVFAWMKAMDERGISASRSIEKLEAWMLILSRPDVAEVLANPNNYNAYGRPALKEACKMLNIKYPEDL